MVKNLFDWSKIDISSTHRSHSQSAKQSASVELPALKSPSSPQSESPDVPSGSAPSANPFHAEHPSVALEVLSAMEPNSTPTPPIAKTNRLGAKRITASKRKAQSTKTKRKSSSQSIEWSTIGLAAISACGALGALALVWLTSLPPLPDCSKISALSSDVQRLYCARETAQSGELPDLIAGLKVVGQWSPEQTSYREAQSLLQQWSDAVLRAAYQRMTDEADLKGAVSLASSIPRTSPLYPQAQEAIASWKLEWTRGDAIYREAEAAIKAQDWNTAAAQVLELADLDHAYWREQKSSELTHLVIREKEAWSKLKQAQELIEKKGNSQLIEAIALARQADPQSFAWQTIKPLLQEWSNKQLSSAWQQWQQGNRAQAIAMAQGIEEKDVSEQTFKDLIRYSKVEQMVATRQSSPWYPTWDETWKLTEAIAAIQRIKPDSPLYETAQSELQVWKTQLKDLTQLQYANLIASAGQQFSFQLAMEQAALIAPEQPQRPLAQTLIAFWRQQIERVEDQPYLNYARQLAQAGEVSDLQAAIQVAQQVPQGRALRPDAEIAIAQWTDQIETIEDTPILQKAQALAQDNKLKAAIIEASRIEKDRALYRQAREAIASWQRKIDEIQIAEDRPILNEAYSLASRERLTLAIEKASTIARGRALYNEAQSAIAQWKIEREAIWDRWAAEAEQNQWSDPYSDSYYDGSY